ncbi:MAG: hypothetical protein GY719_26030 [bacterium]|nr:hypothetical protein [bacterium]
MSHELADALGATLSVTQDAPEIIADRLRELAIEMRSGRWGAGPKVVAKEVSARGCFVASPAAILAGSQHPEQREDEVFICNATVEAFRRIGHTSKRAGLQAYGADGAPIHETSPVFVGRGELSEHLRARSEDLRGLAPETAESLEAGASAIESGAHSLPL